MLSCYKASVCMQVWAVLSSDRLLLTSPDSVNHLVVVKNTVFLQDVVGLDFTRPHRKSQTHTYIVVYITQVYPSDQLTPDLAPVIKRVLVVTINKPVGVSLYHCAPSLQA